MNPAIALIVWDLDDTLLDTTRLLIPVAKTPQFELRIRQPLPLMPGARENLDYCRQYYQQVLLTFGRPDAQQAKIESLKISQDFDWIAIADPAKNETKKQYFQKIVEKMKVPAQRCLSIGNRRSSDIGEAKEVGFLTCLFHYGEHFDEKVATPFQVPDWVVSNHQELRAVCGL